jgi:serine/threonine protein kinase
VIMADRVGERFGNYHLIKLIGEGGFAEVYLGEHIHLDSLAAVKILTTRLTDDEISTFRNEARIIINLDHPHIIRVLDFGLENNTPYIVMGYAPNGSLRNKYPRTTRLSLSTIVTYVNQITSALYYVHNQKLIHRDIKPENMLIGGNNEILLSDFGIASVAHSSRSLKTGVGSGTINYMSPEQIQGKARPSSDQYSLGIVIYEWLCGVRPFQGTYWEITTQHLSTQPPSFEKSLSIVPDIEQVVMKALAKDPKQRFANVKEFAFALEGAVQLSKQHTSASSFSGQSSVPQGTQPLNISTNKQSDDILSTQQEKSAQLNSTIKESSFILTDCFTNTPPIRHDSFTTPPTYQNAAPNPPLDNLQQPTIVARPSKVPTTNNDLPSQEQILNKSVTSSYQPNTSRDLETQQLINNSYQQKLFLPSPGTQQLAENQQPQRTSIASNQRKMTRNLVLAALVLTVIFAGVVSFILVQMKSMNNISSTLSTIQNSKTPVTTPTEPEITPTENVNLDIPVISQGDYSAFQIANDSTNYTFSAQIINKDKNPTQASDVTCKLWLTKEGDVNAILRANNYAIPKTIDTIQQPFPKEVVGAFNYIPPSQQTQPCAPVGTTTWSYTISQFVAPGIYSLVVLTDWNGKSFNWSWVQIVIKKA